MSVPVQEMSINPKLHRGQGERSRPVKPLDEHLKTLAAETRVRFVVTRPAEVDRVHEVERTIAQHASTRHDRASKLYALLVFELWHREYVEKQPSSSAAGSSAAASTLRR